MGVRQQGGCLAARYRNHLILEKAILDRRSGFWRVKAHIQFNEHINFRDIVITGPVDYFKTQKQAESYIIRKAKEWVDKRLEDL